MRNKWIIFDAMGVIFEVGDDTNDLLIPYITKLNPNINSKQIIDLYTEASLGKISSRIFWEKLGFKNNYQSIETNYLNQCLTLDKNFNAVANKLMDTYKLALLSNDVSEWSYYLRKKFNLNKFFKEIVISGDVGYRKPSEEIYKIILNRINCKEKDCVFIDDRLKNLIPAMKLKMQCIKFKRDHVFTDQYKGFEIESFTQLPDILKRVFC